MTGYFWVMFRDHRVDVGHHQNKHRKKFPKNQRRLFFGLLRSPEINVGRTVAFDARGKNLKRYQSSTKCTKNLRFIIVVY